MPGTNRTSFDLAFGFLCSVFFAAPPLPHPPRHPDLSFSPLIFSCALFISFLLPSLEQEFDNGCINPSRDEWQCCKEKEDTKGEKREELAPASGKSWQCVGGLGFSWV